MEAEGKRGADKLGLDERRLQLEERRFEAEDRLRESEDKAKKVALADQDRQARFDRRYRLLDLRERRADRAIKARELEANQGRGIRFTTAQATVAAAAVALVSALLGAFIQGATTRDVEADKNRALIAIEELKAKAGIDLEAKKQEEVERLDRAKFETTLILKAIEAVKREDQIRNLKFFLNADFIHDPSGKIAAMDERAYPSLPPPTASTPSDIYTDSQKSIGFVRVVANSATGEQVTNTGTCFVVSKDGYALTSAHLLSGVNGKPNVTVAVGSVSAFPQPADIIKLDNDSDLALIKLNGALEFSPIRISRDRMLVGDPITIMGYPMGRELTPWSAYISSLNVHGGMIRIDMEISPGQAGSPVLNKNGDAIAIVSGRYGESREHFAVAVPIRFARQMLEQFVPD